MWSPAHFYLAHIYNANCREHWNRKRGKQESFRRAPHVELRSARPRFTGGCRKIKRRPVWMESGKEKQREEEGGKGRNPFCSTASFEMWNARFSYSTVFKQAGGGMGWTERRKEMRVGWRQWMERRRDLNRHVSSCAMNSLSCLKCFASYWDKFRETEAEHSERNRGRKQKSVAFKERIHFAAECCWNVKLVSPVFWAKACRRPERHRQKQSAQAWWCVSHSDFIQSLEKPQFCVEAAAGAISDHAVCLLCQSFSSDQGLIKSINGSSADANIEKYKLDSTNSVDESHFDLSSTV